MIKKRDVTFLYEIGSLRNVQRTWRQFFGSDVANNSEHIFRVMWTALIIARSENIKNEEKIIKMALVHDIAESRVPDTNYLSKAYSTRDEDKALKDILDETSLQEDFLVLFHEYEKRESIEAKIVKDADNLDADLEINEQAAMGNQVDKIWISRRKKVYDSLYTQTAKKMWKELYITNPQQWHVDAHEKVTKKEKQV